MKQQGEEWFDGLIRFIGECRSGKPIADRTDLNMKQEMQCRIIGGSLIAWLEEHGPHLLQERAFLANLRGWERDPFIVFTSYEAGIVAANEILEENSGRFAVLYPQEFSVWLETNPDADYLWHVHVWSLFGELDTTTLRKAAQYALSEGESYMLHKEGTRCGPLFGRGGDHLWKWTGTEAILLQECINQWIS